MYFVYSGVLDVEVNGKVVTQLKEGAFFGEVALLGQVPRTASITARRNTCLYSLDRETLEDILIDYEDVSQKMQKIYEERVQKALSENESRTEEQKKQLSIRKIQSRLNSEREKRKSGGSFENTRKSGSSFDKGTSSRRQSESLASSIPADFFADRQKVNPIVTTENITAKLDLALDDVIE